MTVLPVGTSRGSIVRRNASLKLFSGNRFVCQSQLAQSELAAEQPVGVRLSSVAGAQVIEGAGDDAGVVMGEASWGPHWHKPGGFGEAGRKPIERYHFDVRDGQNPAALITMRVVEHMQLARMQSADVGFFTQRPVDSLS